MGKSNLLTVLMNPKMLVKSLNPAELFSASGWTRRKTIYSQLIDPAGLFFKEGNGDKIPKPPTDQQAVADSAVKRDAERRRLASSGSQTTYSGRRADALSASIGKRKLGGAA